MNTPARHLVFAAGETSGDIHAAHLIEELKNGDPSLTFSGLGGPLMREQGADLLCDMTEQAVVGFAEVVRHYPRVRKIFYQLLDHIDSVQPAAVVLVDYPGFNLRLAKELKKRGVKVIYYISPQVWAWKENRVKQIKSDIDLMLVLFPFEQEFYVRHGVNALFVGHPLVDQVKTDLPKNDVLRSLGLTPDRLTVGILPGSRAKEVKTMLPIMLNAARILSSSFFKIQFLLFKAPGITVSASSEKKISKLGSIEVVEGNIHDALNACDVCMVTSGTATLETALLKKPMVVVYKTSWLTYMLAKLFVRIPDIALVNVVAGKRIVPECLQGNATGEHIAMELRAILTDETRIASIRAGLEHVQTLLGEPGASRQAATAILQCLNAQSVQDKIKD